MATQTSLILGLLLLLFASIFAPNLAINRNDFPSGFLFGTSSSAYQYEGNANGGGRGQSMWDYYTHSYPERIQDGSNGDVAIDFYNRYEDDIRRMKEMGLNSFRFSISWPRLIPSGKICEGINHEGIKFYHRLIDALIHNGIEPLVTIFHWDIPQYLEDDYGGFLSRKIVHDYLSFADLCFKEFGPKVKLWITFNEPYVYSTGGYGGGFMAPGRCSSWVNDKCEAGNSATEPYIVSHNMLLAHAAAVRLYRTKYQKFQRGKIGIALNTDWFIPYSNSTADIAATKRAIDFNFGWHMDPITIGEYPKTMRQIVGCRLPNFTVFESMMLKGSYDFVGINYYSTHYAAHAQTFDTCHLQFQTDNLVNLTYERNGVPIGPQADPMYIYPPGLRYLLNYTKYTYNNPEIYITENGVGQPNNKSIPLVQALNDTLRIYNYEAVFGNISKAISEDEVNVKGFLAWSFADNFEWSSGYTVRFGLWYIDFDENYLTRCKKASVYWFTKFLHGQSLKPDVIRSDYFKQKIVEECIGKNDLAISSI